MWGVTRSILLLEHAQDVITVVVGLVLVVLAAILLISGISEFFHTVSASKILSAESVINAATGLLDEVLLVLILIEIVHTVVLSLHSHRLVAQPFIIVGLVAVIRKILFVLSEPEAGQHVRAGAAARDGGGVRAEPDPGQPVREERRAGSGLLIRGFGVQVPGGAPLIWDFYHIFLTLGPLRGGRWLLDGCSFAPIVPSGIIAAALARAGDRSRAA